MAILTFATYCKNRNIRYNSASWRENGEWFYLIEGTILTQKELDEKYPISGKIISANEFYKGLNPCKKLAYESF